MIISISNRCLVCYDGPSKFFSRREAGKEIDIIRTHRDFVLISLSPSLSSDGMFIQRFLVRYDALPSFSFRDGGKKNTVKEAERKERRESFSFLLLLSLSLSVCYFNGEKTKMLLL